MAGRGLSTHRGWEKACRSREHAIPIQSDLRFTFAVYDKSFVVDFTLQRGPSRNFVMHVALAIANAAADLRNVLDHAAALTIRCHTILRKPT